MNDPGDFLRWLHALVYRLTGPGDPNHDDLVSEGMIAMWRAKEKFDPDKGSEVSWMIRAAEMRIKGLAFGHEQPFGHAPCRGSKAVQEVTSLDGMEPGLVEEISGRDEITEAVVLAYHHGEMGQAIAELSPMQRKAVHRVLRDEIMTDSERACWGVARKRLAAKLAHLNAM